ncbi:hypothetical protein [Methylomonas methanica]|jgi:hypothetical protein|uniref:Uncharacterized protein n=1 Tax=Methylomonas methanica TaxID=421 RepID=A0A177MAK4_METMH|nr:hypothetical protein [Methylomonas methanica]OAI01839.1 hypothetical protein A1332_16900 [Methylomonas methanica]
MLWEINPGKSVGQLHFGMTREQVINCLGNSYDEFRRTSVSENLITAYDNEGLHLVFNQEGKLEQVSIFFPNEAILGSIQLLGRDIGIINQELIDGGFIIETVDAGLWCAHAKILVIEAEGQVDGVEVHI